MPSATMLMPSAWPSDSMVRRTLWLRGRWWIAVMNERSTLSSSAVMSASTEDEEEPVPEAAAELADHRQHLELEAALGHEGVLGELQHDPPRVAALVDRLHQGAHEIEVAGLLGGDVDADGGAGAERRVELLDRADRLLDH